MIATVTQEELVHQQKFDVLRIAGHAVEEKQQQSELTVLDDAYNNEEVEALEQSYPDDGRQPFPTLSEIRDAVPKHCFDRSLTKSIAYVVFDYMMIYACYQVLPYVEPAAGLPGLFAWYWITGLWFASAFVIGHDCGHGAFSKYTFANDFFGHVAFGPIFSPYFGWQRTHRKHHQYTTHIEKDTSHPWVREEEFKSRGFFSRHFCKLPFSGFLRWDPIYTVLGLPDGSHYWPWSRIFKTQRDRIECVISGIVSASCVAVAFYLCNYDPYTFMKYYWIPVHFQGFWLIAITFMQHHHEEAEVFEEGTWTYMRGQAETIDRVFGFGLDWVLHHATDGHVAHHYFPRMPHYHLIEATEHIERVLAKYPGVYKKKPAPLSLIEFCWLNIKCDYLLQKTKGNWKYRCSKDFQKSKSQ